MKSKTENSSLDFETENIKNSFSFKFHMKSMFNLVGIELICTPAAVCVSYQIFRGSKQGFWYKDKTPHLLKYCNYGHAS